MAERTRAWLDVDYAEKDEAKRHGARWDPRARRWYAPHGITGGLTRWAPRGQITEELPGEDRRYGAGLFVDLVPDSCWFTNVRSCVDKTDWQRLRRMVIGRASGRCEACGTGEARDIRRWLEVHERWAFDDTTGTQTLKRLICLCTDCHTTTHYGLAQLRGDEIRALTHLRTVTGMSHHKAEHHVADAFTLWQRRNQRTWTLDLSILTDAGVTLAPPPSAEQRPAAAARALERARRTDHPAPPTRPAPRTAAGSDASGDAARI